MKAAVLGCAFAALLLAGCTAGPSLRDVLTSPAAQADPLKALAQSGYPDGSEPYQAAQVVLGQGVSAKDPQFAGDVYNQIVTMDIGKSTNTIQN